MSVARKKRAGEEKKPHSRVGEGPGERVALGSRVSKPTGEGPSRFARRLLTEWRRRGWAVRGEGVVVGVSGGADSTALLLALEELKAAGLLEVSLTAAHLDHGLRGERGAEDARWVEGFARAHGFEAVLGRAEVGELARAGRDNLEQAARRARYEFLAEVARGRGAGAVLVAHTLDDQAETVLLRLLRGSGAEGLGGMRAERALLEGVEAPLGEGVEAVNAEGGEELPEGGEALLTGGREASRVEGVRVVLRRPLLAWARRADTEAFCRARGVEFRADEMNEDERFARVRVRRRLLPLLETFNPRARQALARAAELLREDTSALELLASRLLEEARGEDVTAGGEAAADSGARAGGEAQADDEAAERGVERRGAWPLRVSVLNGAPAALRRRALRQWVGRGRGGLRRLTLAHLLGVERLLEGTRGGRVAELPGGCRVERRRGLLRFLPERNKH
jgi:tRNA(Ile)-lysidine synthase